MRSRRSVIAAAFAAALCIGTAAAPAALAAPPPAPAPSPSAPDGDQVRVSAKLLAAQQAADHLRALVGSLQLAAEQATERYNAAASRTAQLGAEHARAVVALAAARREAARTKAIANDRARALYMTGGNAALVATVLSGSSPMDVLTRYEMMGTVFAQDRQRLIAAGTAAAQARQAERQLADVVAQQKAMQQLASAAMTQVKAALSSQQTLLSSAASDVQAIIARQQAAEAAAARALAQLFASISGTAEAHVSPTIAKVLKAAQEQLGKPYVWGAAGPNAFDCSGLVQFSFAAAGIKMPRTAADQWFTGSHPTLDKLQPGDLLFWASDATDASTIHHVTIYLGKGYMIAAPHTGSFVQIQKLYAGDFFGATHVEPQVAAIAAGQATASAK